MVKGKSSISQLKPAIARLKKYVDDKWDGNLSGFCRASNVSYSAARRWFGEQKSVPSEATLRGIAASLHLNPEWLIHGNGPMELPAGAYPLAGARFLPVLSFAQAGAFQSGLTPEDAYPVGHGESVVPYMAEKKLSAHAFALRIEGDSMTPRIEPGDIVYVEPEVEPQNGDIVIAASTAGEVWCKKLRIQAGVRWLVSFNLEYPAIPMDGNIRIVGLVVGGLWGRRA